ncbi:hypothetical protein [Sphingopyxis sp. DBS4]|uniref:hypothetical protein n=1 Tax=Sphingopyxis sp. DBS4 TaxID=2968500 RepID=UPI00214CF191|nr:hypothetical protein [Sphingopyxis sp. DBS4]
MMLAALPFLWLVARDALHLAFADEEETQRLVYNVLIPGVYSALDRNERLRPSKPSGETVISLNFEPIADALPPCFDLLRVEIAPRYATDPPIDVAKDWAEHSLRRPWGISNADMTDYEENVALSPFRRSLFRPTAPASKRPRSARHALGDSARISRTEGHRLTSIACVFTAPRGYWTQTANRPANIAN